MLSKNIKKLIYPIYKMFNSSRSMLPTCRACSKAGAFVVWPGGNPPGHEHARHVESFEEIQ